MAEIHDYANDDFDLKGTAEMSQPIPVTDAIDSAWNELEAARAAYERAFTHLTNVAVKDFHGVSGLAESISATILSIGADQRLAAVYRQEHSNG